MFGLTALLINWLMTSWCEVRQHMHSHRSLIKILRKIKSPTLEKTMCRFRVSPSWRSFTLNYQVNIVLIANFITVHGFSHKLCFKTLTLFSLRFIPWFCFGRLLWWRHRSCKQVRIVGLSSLRWTKNPIVERGVSLKGRPKNEDSRRTKYFYRRGNWCNRGTLFVKDFIILKVFGLRFRGLPFRDTRWKRDMSRKWRKYYFMEYFQSAIVKIKVVQIRKSKFIYTYILRYKDPSVFV